MVMDPALEMIDYFTFEIIYWSILSVKSNAFRAKKKQKKKIYYEALLNT